MKVLALRLAGPALFGCMLGLLAPPLAADGGPAPSAFDAEAAIRYSQAAVGRRIGDYRFLDRRGKPASLAELRDKPLVINLVYTACTHTCPLIVQTLQRAVEVAQDALGADSFSVVTIGFDSDNDTPARMRAYALGQGVKLPNWRFLSAERATIDKLSADLGFIYFPSPRGFDHLAQTTVIDPEGRVYRHVYGADFDAPALVEPLKDLMYGRQAGFAGLEGLVERVRLFCTYYDPSSERYKFDYSIFISMAVGLLSMLGFATILVNAWRRSRRDRRRA